MFLNKTLMANSVDLLELQEVIEFDFEANFLNYREHRTTGRLDQQLAWQLFCVVRAAADKKSSIPNVVESRDGFTKRGGRARHFLTDGL